MNKLGKYHDLYLKSVTLILADVFQNFRKICLKIYQIDAAKCFSTPRLAWQADLKETKIEL